jgi:YidC/Oxa1 family membrane protein insertase
MDSYRLFVGLVFAVSVFLLVDAWVRDKQAKPAPAPPATQALRETPLPSIETPARSGEQGKPPEAGAVGPRTAGLASGERIRVKTDYLLAEIDTLGGDLRRVELLQHKERGDKDKSFVLLQESPERLYVAQSGLFHGEGLADHKTLFAADSTSYELGTGQEALKVRLEAPPTASAKVVKTYTFHRSSYVVDVSFEVTNLGDTPSQPDAYFQLVRDSNPAEGDSKLVPTYTGAELYTEKDKLQKVGFSDIESKPVEKSTTDGWIAFVQHYFLSAWLVEQGRARVLFLEPLPNTNGLVAGGVITPVGTIEPKETANVTVQLYTGPQEQERLKALAPGLELTVDYGWLRVLAVPLFWILDRIHGLVGNWGVAIILLTVLIKLAFYPLSAASYKSMARMKVLAPKLQRLKERYGDDRQKMHQAMMELYKTEKINPLGGCLPIVVQIPVFIALYWVLLLSVELRHAPFMLWISDLSTPDPYFVLPVLMGATMFIQTWLNPTPPDPMQAKLMKIMPIAFSIFFFFFASGLVLYWLVNNILSIGQQWQITRALERSKAAHGGT